MNDQTEAIVDPEENSHEKRMSEDKEEHVGERKSDDKTKIDRKVGKSEHKVGKT